MSQENIKKVVTIYTDGACSGNPGPGGWGALLICGKNSKEIFGGQKNSTNNKMELTAVIEALKALKVSCQVDIYTDSAYVKNGMTLWIIDWKTKGWKTSKKHPVKNSELWQELDKLTSLHEIRWHWVKAHAGNKGNERADELARKGVESVK